jgi:hypothetical protein
MGRAAPASVNRTSIAMMDGEVVRSGNVMAKLRGVWLGEEVPLPNDLVLSGNVPARPWEE